MVQKLKAGSIEYDVTVDTKGIDKASKEVDSGSKKMAKSIKAVGAAFALYLGAQQVRQIIMIADSMQVLESRLRAATKSQQEFNQVQIELTKIARENGVAIEDTIELYTQLNDSLRIMGASTEQVTQLIDSVQKLGKIGGSSAEDLSRSLFQFNQALSGGVFRAEEFNSILDATPKIVDAIAEGMGKSRGELRQMMLDGELFADDVLKAILGQTEQIEENYSKIRQSATDAAQSLTNELKILVLNLDKELGITEAIASVMNALTGVVAEQNAKYTEQGKITEQIEDNNAEILAIEKEIRKIKDEASRQGLEIVGIENDYLNVLNQSLEALKAENTELDRQIQKINDVNNAKAGNTGNISSLEKKQKEEQEHWDQLAKASIAYNKMLAKQQEEEDEHWKKMADASIAYNEKMRAQRSLMLNETGQFLGSMTQLFKRAGMEQTAIAKAAFLAQQAIAVANILVSTEEAAARAQDGTLFGISMGNIIRGMGYASAGITAGITVADVTGAGRQHGGRVSGGLMHPVNEAGQPGLLNFAGKQHLLTPQGAGGDVMPLSSMAANPTSSSTNITLVNESGVPMEAAANYITPNDLEIRLQRHLTETDNYLGQRVQSNTGTMMNAFNKTTTIQRQRNA